MHVLCNAVQVVRGGMVVGLACRLPAELVIREQRCGSGQASGGRCAEKRILKRGKI